jgi:Coenzyme F420-dependent N5,N10-methylene tetrahydromethanopterin reductase and related flavin-dependent oxidoreductases
MRSRIVAPTAGMLAVACGLLRSGTEVGNRKGNRKIDMKFGVHLGPQHLQFEELISAWREIEELGFDWISVWDHLYPTLGAGSVEGPNIEAKVAMTALALVTERVRIGCLVFNASLRNPALLAHSIAAIDELSKGRVELGLGAGWFEREQVESGIPFPSAGVRVQMLEESIAIVRKLFECRGGYLRRSVLTR